MEAGKTMLTEKTPACGRCAFATSVAALIAHCQAAANWFDECRKKDPRQVNLDTTESHPDLFN